MNVCRRLPEIVVCSGKPVVSEIGGIHVIVFIRDDIMTEMITTESANLSASLADRIKQVDMTRFIREWVLPENELSRVIEYKGVSVRFSKIRFGILKTLILANGDAVDYETASKAGWGSVVDIDIFTDAIYNLNKFLKSHGISNGVHYGAGKIFFGAGFGRIDRGRSSATRKK